MKRGKHMAGKRFFRGGKTLDGLAPGHLLAARSGGILGSLLHAVPVPLPVVRSPPLPPWDGDPWGPRLLPGTLGNFPGCL